MGFYMRRIVVRRIYYGGNCKVKGHFNWLRRCHLLSAHSARLGAVYSLKNSHGLMVVKIILSAYFSQWIAEVMPWDDGSVAIKSISVREIFTEYTHTFILDSGTRGTEANNVRRRRTR